MRFPSRSPRGEAAVVRVFTLLAAVTVLVGVVSGCAHPPRPLAWRSSEPNSNLIFNPEWTGLPTIDTARRPWPVAVAAKSALEFQDYRIYFRDTLRPHFGRYDDVYRRVDDVRVGYSSR